MKKFIIPMLILITNLLMAQMPNGFKYQGLARNHNLEVLSEQAIALKVSILAGGPDESEIYREFHRMTTSKTGLFSVAIGRGTAELGTFADIAWSEGTFYLKTEIDVKGNGGFEYAGTSPLLAVPFAMHAKTAELIDDADADPNNEIQTLDFDQENNRLSISGGNAISIPTANNDADADPVNEIQMLTRSGSKIILTEGGEVEDMVKDDDSDPTNEMQSLSYDENDKMLKISGGNAVRIDPGTDGDADPRNEIQNLSIAKQNKLESPFRLTLSGSNSIDLPYTSVWRHSIQNNKISQIYSHVPVTTKSLTAEVLEVTRRPAPWNHPRITQTEYQFRTAFGATGMRMSKHRLAHHYKEGGSKYSMFLDDKSLRFYSRSEWVTAQFGGDKSGLIKLYPGNHSSPYFDVQKTNSNRSQMRMYSPVNKQLIFAVNESSLNAGAASLYGSKSVNVTLGSSGQSDRGGIHVHDDRSRSQAGMFVDGQGKGVLYADIKNFVVDHPTDDEKQIVYASLEGPEAGIYQRGTARIINGKANIEFSEHFSLMLNAKHLTIMLTPLSADSHGLAVVEKTSNGFSVQELMAGSGNYSFDWEVKSIRKGYEDFEVIRNKPK